MEEGEELGGYRLIRRLGTGGAGTVWLAEDGGGTRVALKAMHPAMAASEESRQRLERETRTVNSVRSPFVAHIVDAETEASQPFVVSEYVEGPTLAEILVSGPVPLRGVAALSYHLASTIAAVHHANIIHRDIKPSNIICSPRGPVLIDFGIAMATSDQHLTSTGLVSGTAGYTAPELLQGHGATKESDWWAWCATLLSCATGRPPFGKGDVSATMLRVLEGDPDLAGLHPMVADALAGGLASDPDDRPSPSLIVADLMSAVGWAPGELDYVTVNWAQLLDTGMRTQMVNSDPQEIAAPPEWEDAGQRPDASGARAVSYPQYAWHDDATDTWQVVDDADPTEVMAPYAQPQYPGPQGAYDPGFAPGYGQQSYPQAGVAPQQMATGPQWNPNPVMGTGAASADGASSAAKGTWISGAAVLALLASLPFLFGLTGSMIVGIVLIAFGLIGAMERWLERRRILRGAKASDRAAVIAMSPILLVRSILSTALGLVIGGLVPYGIWVFVSYSREGRVLWSWPADVVATTAVDRTDYWLSDPRAVIVVWALAAVMMLTAWLMPLSADLRVGVSTVLRSIVRPAWGRGLLAVGCVAFLAGAWFTVTGGLSH